MKIAIAWDHGGYELKEMVAGFLMGTGHQVIDLGTDSAESVDYPEYGRKCGLAVVEGEADRGIVVCGTGIGISIAANKVKGVRCALVNSVDAAILTREHNDSNCLAMGAKYTPNELAIEIVDTWLNTNFSNMEKHTRRINKITNYENEVK